jgi:hypothetical protein
MTYLSRLLLLLDMAINVLRGGRVETVSSAMGRAIKEGRRCILCKLICGALDRRWKDHCINNIMTPLDKG